MEEGKRVRVKIKTRSTTYDGTLLIPPMRNRVSDILNDEEKVFINIVEVRIDEGKEIVPHVSINKHLIESSIETDQ